MPHSESQTIEKLIETLNCNETVAVFKRKRSFIFNFAMIWNLFEDRCMDNFAQISTVDDFVNTLPSNLNLDVNIIFDYFKDRYKVVDNIYNIESLLWRRNENTYRNFVIEKFRDTQCSHQNKIKAVLYIILDQEIIFFMEKKILQ